MRWSFRLEIGLSSKFITNAFHAKPEIQCRLGRCHVTELKKDFILPATLTLKQPFQTNVLLVTSEDICTVLFLQKE